MIRFLKASRFSARIGMTALALGVLGCASDRETLTSEQKDELRAVFESSGHAYGAARKTATDPAIAQESLAQIGDPSAAFVAAFWDTSVAARPRPTHSPRPSPRPTVTYTPGPIIAPSPSPSPAPSPIPTPTWIEIPDIAYSNSPTRLQMARILKDRGCRFKLDQAKTSPSRVSGPRRFLGLSARGDLCPIDLGFGVDLQVDTSRGSWILAFDYTYAVQASDYLALNDINSTTLRGTMRFRGLGTDQTSGEIDMNGRITSQRFGEIPVAVTGSLGGTVRPGVRDLRGQIVWRLDFSNFTATLKQEYRGGEDIHYFVNSEEISREEFESYFRRGGEPFFYGSSPEHIK